MKNILISIQPKWTAKILNKEKTIEVRKRFPLNYRGWVYIYCTKDNKIAWYNGCLPIAREKDNSLRLDRLKDYELNGKVVARFYCDKVDTIWKTTTNIWTYGSDLEPNFYKESCLNDIELNKYLKPRKVGFNYQYGYAIHISQLEIFDKPKELSEFFKPYALDFLEYDDTIENLKSDPFYNGEYYDLRIRKAPQSWQYIEVVE